MKFLLLIPGLAALTFFNSMALANVVVRVTPRDDYGNQSSALGRFKDRWDQKGALAQGQNMGGNYDVLMRKDLATNEVEVMRCPTAKNCFEDTPDRQVSCFSQSQYWSCESIYKGTSQAFCRHYAVGHRAQAVVHFIGDQFLGGIITGPFSFFQRGVGLAALRVSTGVSAYNALKSVVSTECEQDQPTEVVANDTLELTVQNVKVFTEIEKGEVRNFIELFTPNSGLTVNTEVGY